MSFSLPSTGYTGSITSAFRQTVSMPAIEGAAGVVAGIVIGDVAGNYLVSALKQTTTTATLVVKGVAKFVVAGLALFASSRAGAAGRVIGTTAALGSIASWLVDLLAASPFAKTLGLAAVKAFQVNVPYGRRTAGVVVQSAASQIGTKSSQITIGAP
jgi:hypothetical protein